MHGELNHGVRVEQIYTLQYPGDERKEEFAQNWMVMIEDNDCQLPETTLRRILYGKLKNSKDLEHDIKHFERVGRDHPDHSHDYLVKCLWDDINRKKLDKVELEYNLQTGTKLGAPLLKGGIMAGMMANATPSEVTDKKTKRKLKKLAKKEAKANGQQAAGGGGAGGGGGGGGTPGPKAKAKAKAKAKGKARAKGAPAPEAAPAPPKPHEEEREPKKTKKGWTKKELAKVCYYHQFSGCWYPGQCGKEHVLVPANLRDSIPKPKPKSVTPGGGGKGGKGDGKGKQRSTSQVKSVKMFCKKFLDTGACDDPKCKGPFLDADAVKKLQDAYPGKINEHGYLSTDRDDKGKGKGKSKKK